MLQSLVSVGNMPAVPTECEAVCDPDSVRTFWVRERNILLLPRPKHTIVYLVA